MLFRLFQFSMGSCLDRNFFLPRQSDHTLKDIGFLCAGQGMAAVKQEARYTGHAHLMRDPVFLTDKFPIHVTGKIFQNFVSVFAMANCDIGQKFMIADILTFKEIGYKQIFDQIIANRWPFCTHLVDQAMRVR